MNTKLTNALSELSVALGGGYARGEYWDHECVLEAIRRLSSPDIPASLAAKALGSVKSERKSQSSAKNGKLGGRRPRKCRTCGSNERQLRAEIWVPNTECEMQPCDDLWHQR